MSFQALRKSLRSGRPAAHHAFIAVTRYTRSQAALNARQQLRSISVIVLQPKRVSCLHLPGRSLNRPFSSAADEVVPVPTMGDSISEGTVVEWLKAPGEFVKIDEVVVVIETDKVSVDVRAPSSGVLEAQLAQVDETVLVGSPLFSMKKQFTGNAPVAASMSKEQATSVVSPEENFETVNVPSMGDSISEGTVVAILKSVGDHVRADEAVLIVETDKVKITLERECAFFSVWSLKLFNNDKVSVDVKAPVSGKLVSVLAKLEDVVEVESPLFVIDKAFKATAESAKSEAPSKPTVSVAHPSPDAASEEVPIVSLKSSTTTSTAPAISSERTFGSYNRNEIRVQMSALKVRASQRLKDTQNSAAMLSTFQECDLGNLIALRDELGETFNKSHGVRLGIMSAFLKASAQALLRIPAANSVVDMDAKEIIYNEFVDINVAVASERGVVMPVVRNVEKLSIVDIEKTLTSLGTQARDGTLALEDLAGGTFTISNSGVNGALLSTSMLTAPQSAVLGVHGIKMRPTVLAGKAVPRPMMYLSLTYDHRIIDGREGVTLLKSIAEAIADPRRLLLDM
ncbi:hypothetical protein CCR75_009546 [Bremia lactucae]|uniref:Dihydrolipoamide acetyltransferase component of pyruvate dehydrogenase complex n=1 Tax=Bremia lactucae TaxID=4779 RepID=A0A976NZD8_BRELC|nr:hypothetical protein CCR75_009546 [Bremia lactucae]